MKRHWPLRSLMNVSTYANTSRGTFPVQEIAYLWSKLLQQSKLVPSVASQG
jgi:hypothetical protein